MALHHFNEILVEVLVMSVICKVGFDQVKGYVNSNVTTRIGKRKHKVYFRIGCDEINLMEAINVVKANDNFICIDYIGAEESDVYRNLKNTGVLIIRTHEFGNNITDEDVESIMNDTPDGVTPVIKLPNDFMDLRLVWKFSKKFSKVRFCGGDLFSVDGCRLGCCGTELFRSIGVNERQKDFNKVGCSCFYDVVNIDDIEIEVSQKKSRSSGAKKSAKKPTAKKPKISFASLLSANPLDI